MADSSEAGTGSPALQRLREDDALRSLAALSAEELLATPLADLVAVQPIAAAGTRTLRAIAQELPARRGDAGLHAWVEARLSDDRPIGRRLPPGTEDLVRPLLAVPWTPSEALVLRLLRHDALRSLVSETLANTLKGFAMRARSMDDGVLGGIGGRALKRGRGLLGQVGSAAEGLVGAVSKEVEAAVEARIREFLEGATDEALKGIAAWLADPRHAEALARLRESSASELSEATVRDLVGTAADDLARWEDALIDGVSTLAERPDLERDLTVWLESVLDETNNRPLGEALPDPALREAATELVQAAVLPSLTRIVHSEAFTTWWQRLHA